MKWLSKYKLLSAIKTTLKQRNSSEDSSNSPMSFCKWCVQAGNNNSFASGMLFHFSIFNVLKLFYLVYFGSKTLSNVQFFRGFPLFIFKKFVIYVYIKKLNFRFSDFFLICKTCTRVAKILWQGIYFC